MAITWLATSQHSRFPPVEQATEQGLLAAGGDLSAERLLAAYRQGIFPWFNRHDPILWWCPDPRMVLYTAEIKVSKSLRRVIKKSPFDIKFDTAFKQVMNACALPRQHQDVDDDNHTWIHQDMIQAYHLLHQQGYAHSVECWHHGELVGGLYGVCIGKVFFGESMFSQMKDASKIALVALCQQLQRWDVPLIDCQIYSDHLASLGAIEIPREQFCQHLEQFCQTDVLTKVWQLDADLPQP